MIDSPGYGWNLAWRAMQPDTRDTTLTFELLNARFDEEPLDTRAVVLRRI